MSHKFTLNFATIWATSNSTVQSSVTAALGARKAAFQIFYNLWYKGSPLPRQPTLAERWPGIGNDVERYHNSIRDLYHNPRQVRSGVRVVPLFDRRILRHWDPDRILNNPVSEHTWEMIGPTRLNMLVPRAERVELELHGLPADLIDLKPTYLHSEALPMRERVGSYLVHRDWDFKESPATRATSTCVLSAPFWQPAYRRSMFITQGATLPEHSDWSDHMTGDQFRKARADHQRYRDPVDMKYDWH